MLTRTSLSGLPSAAARLARSGDRIGSSSLTHRGSAASATRNCGELVAATSRSCRLGSVSSSSATSETTRTKQIFAIGHAKSRDALAGEERERHDLRDDERQHQQRREPAGEALRQKPHSGVTSPAKL